MSVGQICQREVDLVEVGETVRVAAHRMGSRNVGSLVVVDRARRPIGVVTDRDLTLRVLARDFDPRETLVGEVMTAKPRTITFWCDAMRTAHRTTGLSATFTTRIGCLAYLPCWSSISSCSASLGLLCGRCR